MQLDKLPKTGAAVRHTPPWLRHQVCNLGPKRVSHTA
ncbi:hypothetical protein CSUI_008276 [Cystoisospora suis]|uniref:Uncharacterized protein n=1 Tax=Cystoisospora suis TaxID=483139 RepID=A0A2C6KN45_9APIC|nr:hypothetical protein CSUI_008276 [Cystoisospora suis]